MQVGCPATNWILSHPPTGILFNNPSKMPDMYETQQADSAGDCVVGVDFRYVELILIIATKQQAQV